MHHCPPSDSTPSSAAGIRFLQHNHVLLNVPEYWDRPLIMPVLHPEGWGEERNEIPGELSSFVTLIWGEHGEREEALTCLWYLASQLLTTAGKGIRDIKYSLGLPLAECATWDAEVMYTTKLRYVEAVEFAKMSKTNVIIYSQSCVLALNHFGKYKMWSISHLWILKWLPLILCLDPWCYYHFRFYFYSHNLNCVAQDKTFCDFQLKI